VHNPQPKSEIFDPELVTWILQRLASIPDWAVLKGWLEYPKLRGDIDAVVRPSAVSDLTRELTRWAELQWIRAVIACSHLPGVVRFFLWVDGNQAQFLELDFVLYLTFRGLPLISYERVRPHLVMDKILQYPRTSRACLLVIEAMFNRLNWHQRCIPIPTDNLEGKVLRDLAGPILGSLIERSLKSKNSTPWALLASLAAILRAMAKPKLLSERMRFRKRSPVCSLDPRLGREVRLLGKDPQMRLRAILRESGHMLLSPDAAGVQ
jgi:hypothetical protein